MIIINKDLFGNKKVEQTQRPLEIIITSTCDLVISNFGNKLFFDKFVK